MSLTKQLHELRAFDDRHKWLLDADLTYCSGRFLLMSDNFFFRSSGGYLLHQASEKYLKTLRKVVRPQVKIEKHGHDLRRILGDVKGKIEASSFEKITESMKDIEALEQFRYMDQKVNRDIETMRKGLEATDCLVTSLRENIDNNSPLIAGKGLRRYIEGSNNKDQNLLIDSLLRDNSSPKYWINHLSGINARIDRKLRKYQTI
jgi:HEPN domain-containing protein